MIQGKFLDTYIIRAGQVDISIHDWLAVDIATKLATPDSVVYIHNCEHIPLYRIKKQHSINRKSFN